MAPKTQAELDAIRDACKKMVTRRALVSAAAAVVPIPGVDVSTDVAILLQVLPQINERFGLSAKQVEALSPELQKLVIVSSASFTVGLLGKVITPSRIIALLQTLGAKKLAGKYASKYIPVVGSIAASTISFVVLKHVCNKHIDECYAMANRLLANVDTSTSTTIDVVATEKLRNTRN